MKAAVLVPESPFPCHSRLVCLHLLSYRGSPFRIPGNDTSSQADSLQIPPKFKKNLTNVTLNLIQHLTKPKTNKTLKQVQGDKKEFLRDYQHLELLLQLHRLAAAMKGSIPSTGHNKLCATFLTNIPFPNLIRHLIFTSSTLNRKTIPLTLPLSPLGRGRARRQFQILRFPIFFTKVLPQNLAHWVAG
jgi:hypothetical protein